ncbi:hypothetical protein CEQ90_19995, partial [Lewinellaceae bacterium SD302]
MNITVVPFNDAPDAMDDAPMVDEDATLTDNVVDNDTDVDGPDTLITLVTDVTNGTLTLNPDGSYTYVPDADYNGPDSFAYSYCDGGTPELCDTATVNITVTPVNDAPDAMDDAPMVDEDDTLTDNVVDNDTDVDGPDTLITLVTDVTNGTLTLNPDGSYTYVPDADYNGPDSFVYSYCDGGTPELCDTATVNITVVPVNDPPVITPPDTVMVIVPEDTPDTTCFVITDADAGDVLDCTLTMPGFGTAVLLDDTCVVYTPQLDYNGGDTLLKITCDQTGNCDTVVIIYEVTPVNDAPDAMDDAPMVDEDDTLTDNVVDNDTDVDGPDTLITLVTDVTNGTLTLNPDGSYTYVPDADYNGPDSFVYSYCDGGTPELCDTAMVNIMVVPVNDPPVITPPDTVMVIVPEDTPDTTCFVITDADAGDDLDCTLTMPGFGTAVLLDDTCVVYTPQLDYNGGDTLLKITCDQTGNCDTVVIIYEVTPVNDAPDAMDDAPMVDEDDTLVDNVVTNDTDVDGPDTLITLVTDVTNGTLTLNPDGSYTYVPDADYNGPDSFAYSYCDGGMSEFCDTATVNITVVPVNDPPVITPPDTVMVIVPEDTPDTTCFVITDADAGDVLDCTLTMPGFGTAVLLDDTCVVYTPQLDYNGGDTLLKITCDQTGNCDTVVIIYEVTPINDAPDAMDDAPMVDEDATLTDNVVDNDTDVDGPDTLITLVTDVTNGTLTLNPDGSYTYVPDADYNGPDSFVYSYCDGGTPELCDTATVNITVVPFNDPPVITPPDTVTVIVPEDTPDTTCFVITDADAGDDLDCTLTMPGFGTAVLLDDTCVVYTPQLDYNGGDTLLKITCDQTGNCDTVVIIYEVTPVNDTPDAMDDAPMVDEDDTLTDNVVDNDTDVDGPDTLITLVTDVTNGTLTLNPDGSYTYVPDADYNGPDSFAYSYCDGGMPELCDTATVNITVVPFNDPPVITPPDTVMVIVPEDTPDTTCFVILDADAGDDLDCTLTMPSFGTAVLLDDTCVVYTPQLDYNGGDTLLKITCDQTGNCDTVVIIYEVTPINDAPDAIDDAPMVDEDATLTDNVVDNDTDVDGPDTLITLVTDVTNGTLTLNPDGSYTYVPDADYNGPDSFVYSYCDGGTPELCDTATVNITVVPVNDPPVITPPDTVMVIVPEDTPDTTCFVITDADAGDVLDCTLTMPGFGTAVLLDDTCVVYTPQLDYNGGDTLLKITCDQTGNCDTVVIIYEVTPVNDAPDAMDDAPMVDEDDTLTDNVVDNDTDVDGPDTLITLVTDVTNGTLTLNPDGSYTYVPDADYNGPDSFAYSYCDGGTPELCDTATVNITVTPVNDAPDAMDDAPMVDEDDTLTDNVVDNDTDVDGPDTLITLVTDVTNGTLTLNPDGSYTYVPDTDYNGPDSFVYSYCDGGTPELCDTATVNITVTPVNDAPIAIDDESMVAENGTLTDNVVINDSDIDGPDTLITLVTDVTNGTLTLNPDGSYTYVPDADYNGLDSFVYSYCDGGTPELCDTALVVITVGIITTPEIIEVTTVQNVSITICADISELVSEPSDIVSCGAPANGEVDIVDLENGCFSYTPDNNFLGQDEFCLVLVDDNGNTDTVFVTVNVVPDDANVACITEINVVLEEDCQITLLPSQVLVGDLPANVDEVVIVDIEDINPGNGDIIDGCGTYIYNVSLPPGAVIDGFSDCWGFVNAEDKISPALTDSASSPVDLFCEDFDLINLNNLSPNVSRCYEVFPDGTNKVAGFVNTPLGRRLVDGAANGQFPVFTDGCSSMEICVNDLVSGNNGDCEDVVITRVFTATDGIDCESIGGEANDPTVYSYEIIFTRPSISDVSGVDAESTFDCDANPPLLPPNGFGDENPAPVASDYPFFTLDDGTQVFLD